MAVEPRPSWPFAPYPCVGEGGRSRDKNSQAHMRRTLGSAKASWGAPSTKATGRCGCRRYAGLQWPTPATSPRRAQGWASCAASQCRRPAGRTSSSPAHVHCRQRGRAQRACRQGATAGAGSCPHPAVQAVAGLDAAGKVGPKLDVKPERVPRHRRRRLLVHSGTIPQLAVAIVSLHRHFSVIAQTGPRSQMAGPRIMRSPASRGQHSHPA